MTREALVQWLYRFAALALLMLGGLAWIAQIAIERQIATGEWVGEIVISPDGKRVAASSSANNSISIWPLDDTSRPLHFVLTKCLLHSLAFSPDSQDLVSSAGGFLPEATRIYPGRIDLWDLHGSSKSMRTIFINDGVVAGIEYTASKTLAAVLRRSIGEYNVASGALIEQRPLGENTFDQIRVTTDGRQLVYGHSQGKYDVTVWNANAGELVFEQKNVLTQINHTLISKDGTWLAVCGKGAGSGGRLRVWNLDTGEELHCDAGVPTIVDVAILADRSGVVTLDIRNICLVWKFEGNRLSRSRQFKLDGHPSRLALSHDDKQAVIVTNASIAVWDMAEGRREQVLVDPPRLYQLRRFPRFGKWVLVVLSVGLFFWSIRQNLRLPR